MLQPQLTREAVYGALWQVVQRIITDPPIQTFTRRYADWQTMPASAKPAIVMVQGEEQTFRKLRGVVKWHLKTVLLYYFQAPNTGGNAPDSYPVSAVNGVLDSIERGILGTNPDGTPVQFGEPPTLGGLVNDVFIDGRITYDQVAFDQPEASEGLLIIPVTVEVGV